MIKIKVDDKDIRLLEMGGETYVCLTDIVRGEEGNDHIRNWMRNRNTVEFLGLWEMLNNADFKGVEFDTFRRQAGLNSFNLTPQKWINATNAVGIISKAGNTGGTFAHKDLALEFCTWLSPAFKLLILKELQRLKDLEKLQSRWDIRRYLTKVNYKLQTEAIKEVLVPIKNLPKEKEGLIYAEEADLIYIAMFGITSKQWREDNADLAAKGYNLRDCANTHQLIVLSNLESLNSAMINAKQTDKFDRLRILRDESIKQLARLKASAEIEHELIDSPNLAKQKKLTNTDLPKDQISPNLQQFNKYLRESSDPSFSSNDRPKDGDLF